MYSAYLCVTGTSPPSTNTTSADSTIPCTSHRPHLSVVLRRRSCAARNPVSSLSQGRWADDGSDDLGAFDQRTYPERHHDLAPGAPGSERTDADAVHDSLHPVLETEPVQHVVHDALDRAFRVVQLRTDLSDLVAGGQQAKHLDLALGGAAAAMVRGGRRGCWAAGRPRPGRRLSGVGLRDRRAQRVRHLRRPSHAVVEEPRHALPGSLRHLLRIEPV